MKKFISDYRCPCCNANLSQNFFVDLTEYKANFGSDIICSKYEFNCPRTNKKIIMVESSYMDAKMFWKKSDEKIINNYKKVEKSKNKRCKTLLVYLYYPVKEDLRDILDTLKNEFETYLSQDYKLALVMPDNFESIVDSSWMKNKYFKSWLLEDKFFQVCKGVKYGSMIAEMNILNEMEEWLNYKLVSIYPTITDKFVCVNKNIDWEQLEQRILL